jgi:vitamin B12 transporter
MIETGLPGRASARAASFLVLQLISLLAALTASPALAQTETVRVAVEVSGVVRDATGLVLPETAVAAVTASRPLASTVSDADGRYRLTVPAGVPFELRAAREGFADAVVAISGARAAVTHDLTLYIGGVSDRLVVSASRFAQARTSITSSVSVLDAAEIERSGSASLADALRGLPGLNLESTGREGALTSLFSRGGESDYNLVLIDGVRVNQSGGAFDLSRVSAAEIDRIEVVRGAQSSLWGSDAMGSVVQIITKSAGAGSTAIAGGAEGGSFGALRGNARVHGAVPRVDYHAGITARRTSGAFADRLPDDDRFDQTTFDGGVGASLGSRAAVRTGLRAGTAHGRAVGPFAYGPGDTGTSYDSRDLSWNLDVSHSLGARVTGNASVLYFRSTSTSADTVSDPSFNVYALLRGTPDAAFPDGPRLVRLLTAAEFGALEANAGGLGGGEFLASTPFGVSDFPSSNETRFRRPALRYQADVDWRSGQRLSAGYEFERETNPLVAQFATRNHSFFVQQQFSLRSRWFATIGGRIDDKSRYGTYLSPKVSAGGYLVAPHRGGVSSLKLSASAGTGIKTPQFGELFGGAFADGNPALKPERARTVDAGVEATFAAERLRASATVFDSRYRDLVEFRSSDPFFRLDGRADFINVAGAKAHGVELEAALQRGIAGVTAAASYTVVDSEVTETVNTGAQFQPGQPLLRRPKHSGAVRAAYTAGRATAHGSLRIVGQRHDSSFLFLSTVAGPHVTGGITTDITVNPGYTVGSLGVDVRAATGLTLFARADNIGDTGYESVLGYPGLPRSFTAGVRWNLTLAK